MMNHFKKVLSMALALVMVVATMMIVPLTASAADMEGNGTAANPYKLSSPAHMTELLAIADSGDWNYEELYVEFTKNFNIAGKYLCRDNYASSEINSTQVYWRIDGNGHTVTGQTQPLLWSSAGNVVIKNLNIISNVQSSGASVGAFIGFAKLDNGDITIENCTVGGLVQSQFSNNVRGVGGMVGLVSGSNGTLTIKNCENVGTVNGNGYVGAMIGCTDNGMTIDIINCANKGTVKGRMAGGLVGRVNTPSLTISNSYSAATIALTDLDIMGGETSFGGLIGVALKNTTIQNSYSAYETLVPETAGVTVTTTGCFVGAAVEAPENEAAIDAITLAAHAHTYENACAANCSTEGCTVTREGAGHLVDSPCDTACKRCGEATGSAGHQFDNACDPTCNVPGCGYVNEDAGHVYSSPCDAICNVCGAERTVGEHYYENDADADCNFCGETRTVAGNTATDGGNATGGDTTASGDTTAADEEEKGKGCGSALNSTYAVIALVAVLGFAFVAKKREEN